MRTVTKHFSELSTDELYRILRLRAEVFVVEQDCPYQDLDDRDQAAWHTWIEDGEGDIVGCLRTFRLDARHSQIGRVVTSLKVRGTGVGARLMTEGISVAAEHFPGLPILIHAQKYASPFYARFGFVVSSDTFLEDGIPHVEMLRV